MKIIDSPFSKWSVWASVFFTSLWASLAGAWALIDVETQNSILADVGMTQADLSKLIGYLLLLAAVSSGTTGALRVIKQGEPKKARVRKEKTDADA